MKRLLELAPERIVYVSCNPTTLAPNARTLVDGGYTVERARPVDMFPHTPHIECVALLRREKTVPGTDFSGHAHHSRATASSTSAQRSTDGRSTHSSTA